MERVLIAYSGGVDSTLLLKAASLSGLQSILAVTGSSESLPSKELGFAQKMAADMKVRHRVIRTRELDDENYIKNPPERCYYCKQELFGLLRQIADQENIPFILDGTNADDANDWRPGMRAARDAGVHSPLRDAGLGKDDIREISRILALPTWNKPATPCLSSRFAYGQPITAEALERVNRAEDFLKKFVFGDLRVRVLSDTARIEVFPGNFPILTDQSVRDKISRYFKSLGFTHITLDLQGFRSGSMNESIRDH